MTGLLSTHQLGIEIGGKTICHGLDLNIQTGQCWAVLGINGAGKTTMLHTLAGLRPPAAGHVRLRNHDIRQLSRRSIARQLGLLLQDHEDAFPGTVMQTVLTGRHPHLNNWQWETANDIAIAREALAFVGMEDFADRSILTLSGGERRRVAMATLLCQQPQLYMLDEPTNHLDLRYQHRLLADLTALIHKKGLAAMMIMHDVNLAIRYCDQALLIFTDGELLTGPCREVINTETLSRLYGITMRRLYENKCEMFVPE